MNVKDDIIKNMGRYLHQGYEIFKNNKYRSKELYDNAVDYFDKITKIKIKIYHNLKQNLKQAGK